MDMDLAEIDKFQAMKARRRSFMAVVVQYGLRVLTLGLFLSSPHWLPVARCVVESFRVASLPAIYGVIMRPLPLFVVLNAIIIFLVCDSKLSRTSSLPQRPDLYEEYVAQSQSLQKTAASAPKDEAFEQEEEEPSVELESREKGEENEGGLERESDGDDDEHEEEEEEESTPAEEMDKRFEDFIARVNMQRKLEAARMLVCCG